MTDPAVHCVLCASGEHRPESHDLYRNSYAPVWLNQETCLSVVEIYRIIDERLPYAERFRTESYKFEINVDNGETLVSVDLNKQAALEIAQNFLSAGMDMKDLVR